MPERRQRLLEVAYCLPVGRSHLCPDARLLEVGKRLLPRLALKRVMGQPVDLLGHTVGVERFDGLDDPGVERAPPVLEHAPEGDLVSERMFERVLDIWKEARLVQELGCLKVSEAPANALLGHVRDGVEECHRHVLPDDGGGLKEAFVLDRQSVDACRQDCLRRGRDLPRLRRLHQPIRPRSPTSTWVSTRVRTLSSRKNGFPSVRAISARLSGERVSSFPRSAVSSVSALSGGNGSIRSWR